MLDPTESVPSLSRVGTVTPDRMWMPVALAWKAVAPTVPDLAMWMPPSIVTRWPPGAPIWTPVPEKVSNTPDPVTLPSRIRP